MLEECGLNLVLLLLLGRFSYVGAELTITVTADKCGNEYDLSRHDRINLFLNSSSFDVANTPGVLRCFINLKSTLKFGRTCIQNKILHYDRKCSYGIFDYFTGSKPGKYDLSEFDCYEVQPYCRKTTYVYARFRPFLAWSHSAYLVSVAIYFEKDITTTTTAAPITTTYTYKSPKGKFDLFESLMIPFGVVGGVCGCTCCLICCVYCCGKCCKDEATTSTSNANDNDEHHELNEQPAVHPTAPELPDTFNRTPGTSYSHRQNNYLDEPPDYEKALVTSARASKYSADDINFDIPVVPPPPYPGV